MRSLRRSRALDGPGSTLASPGQTRIQARGDIRVTHDPAAQVQRLTAGGNCPLQSGVSHIHFIGGEKGGVGKSVVARALAQWFIDRSVPFAAIDGDPDQGALSRHYKEYTQPVDLMASESADQIVDRALGGERRVLVDLPAQSSRSLNAWISSANVLEFATEMGIGLTFWHVSDGGFASTVEIQRALEAFGNRVKHVVVKNSGRSKDFSLFDESDAKKKLDELSGKVVEIQELDAATMYRIDRFGLSFWAAAHTAEGATALRALERRRVKLWLDSCYAQFDGLVGVI
jgi:hypothetical protein